MQDEISPEIQRRLELFKITHNGYMVERTPLSQQRQARLMELRAKYPKYGPAFPERTQFKKSFAVYLNFEPIATNKKEAEQAIYHWMCEHGTEITDLLYNKYACEGLRGITLVWE